MHNKRFSVLIVAKCIVYEYSETVKKGNEKGINSSKVYCVFIILIDFFINNKVLIVAKCIVYLAIGIVAAIYFGY